jgi:hypothetical protein
MRKKILTAATRGANQTPMRKLSVLGAFLFLAGGLLSGSVAVAAESKPAPRTKGSDPLSAPIVFKKGARVTRDFMRDERKWCERVLVVPFRNRARDLTWKANAEDYVSRALDTWTSPTIAPSAQKLSEEGAALIAMGCEDPLVRYLAAWTKWQASGEWNGARYGLLKLHDEIQAQPEIDALRWVVTMDYISAALNGNRDTGSVDDQIPTYLQELLKKGVYSPTETNVLVRHLASDRWESVLKKYYRHILDGIKDAKLEPWAADAIRGAAAVSAAWESRGGGWADKVTKEGWQGFEKNLEEARTYLNRSWELNQRDPVAAAEMISVTMAGSGFPRETVRTWFDRATAAEFDFVPAYTSVANATLPRWGGSHESMIAFANACIATGRFDTDAPLGFFAVLFNLDRDAKDLRAVYRDPQLKGNLLKLSRALTEEPTRAAERSERLGYLAVNAWLAGDYKLAASALNSLGGTRLYPGARTKLRAAKTDENRLRAAAPAYASTSGADVEKADEAHERGATAEAIALYKKVLPQIPGAGRPYIEAQLAVLKFETDLAGGGWVEIPASENLLSWISEGGTWKASNGLPACADDFSATRIFFAARVGPAFEMEGTVEITGEPREELIGGLKFAPEFRSGGKQDYYGCQLLLNSSGQAQGMVSDRDYRAREITPMDCELRQVNDFRVRVANDTVTWEVNGKQMHDKAPLRGKMDAGSRVGVGSFSNHPGIFVSLKKLRVRKL